jgi:transcriptional regulator with XRE-family HTH domain
VDISLFLKQLADVLIFHRKKAGLNRVEFARLAGVGKTAIFDMEHAKPTVQLDTLLKVLKALNIKIKIESPLMEFFRKELHEKG